MIMERRIQRLIQILNIPFCMDKINDLKFNTLEDIVNFTFESYNGLLKPFQIKSEILSLLKLLKKSKPKIILEIGTGHGGALFLFSYIAETITIDKHYYFWDRILFNSFPNVRLIKGNSHDLETFNRVCRITDKVDFLFIDGNHTYDGVKKDYLMYKPLVSKGKGMIAFHDILPRPIKTKADAVDVLWEELKPNHKVVEFVEDYNQGWAGIGVILNE